MKIENILICTTILVRMYFVWVSSISVMLNTEVTHSLTHPLIVVRFQIGLANCVFHRFGFCSGHCDALYRRQRDSFPTCIRWIHANQVSSDYINTEPCMGFICAAPRIADAFFIVADPLCFTIALVLRFFGTDPGWQR